MAALIAIARYRIAELDAQGEFDLNALTPAKPSRTSGPIVVGSRSQVLWEVLEDAYTRLGFDAVDNDTFKKLVLAWVFEPTSKADTLRVWDEVGVAGAPPLSTVWRPLGRFVTKDWGSRVDAAAHATATPNGRLTVDNRP